MASNSAMTSGERDGPSGTDLHLEALPGHEVQACRGQRVRATEGPAIGQRRSIGGVQIEEVQVGEVTLLVAPPLTPLDVAVADGLGVSGLVMEEGEALIEPHVATQLPVLNPGHGVQLVGVKGFGQRGELARQHVRLYRRGVPGEAARVDAMAVRWYSREQGSDGSLRERARSGEILEQQGRRQRGDRCSGSWAARSRNSPSDPLAGRRSG